MGQKVHPYGLRLGIIRQSRSRWFAEGPRYRQQLVEDLKIRQLIAKQHGDAGISAVMIERMGDVVTVNIETAKPGMVIGRGGQDVERLRQQIEKLTDAKVRVNVDEARDPDTNAQLVADNIARQIERRISYRRAMRQAVERAMKLGALGIRAMVSGRLGGAEIARTEAVGPEGRVPLHTLRADVEYGLAEAQTTYGNIGVKVWIYKGDILPKQPEPAVEEIEAEEQAEEAATEVITAEAEVSAAEAGEQPTVEVAEEVPATATADEEPATEAGEEAVAETGAQGEAPETAAPQEADEASIVAVLDTEEDTEAKPEEE